MTQPAFSIRPFREGDEHGVLALFNEVFELGNPDFVPRTLDQWNWQFRDNPEGHHTHVAESEGRIVGQYTAVPTRWRMPHGLHHGAQALDTCVATEFRRSLKKTGLFLSLGREWFDFYGCPERDVIVYGFPNPQAFRIGTKRLDYRPVHCPVPEWSLPVAAACEWSQGGVSVQEFQRFGDDVGALDEALGEGFSNVRDARALNWRYADNPNHDYLLLRAEGSDGSLRGMMVATLGWHGDRQDIAPMVDWLVPEGDLATWRALLGELGRRGREAGLEFLLAWAPPWHGHAHDLQSLGFQQTESRFNLCIRVFSDEFTVEDAKRRWYVLMGDSDIY